MEADAIKSGLISANVAHEVNLFALVVRKVTGNDKRIHEVKKFLPGAIVNFEGRSEDWQKSIQLLVFEDQRFLLQARHTTIDA